mmetsp:Transcript_32755/g.77247  ORF Transcript_32755/g.77247 Transcript_32755/m.77247 type:complete len:328 (+) Transcript_32755:4289-5272(+)
MGVDEKASVELISEYHHFTLHLNKKFTSYIIQINHITTHVVLVHRMAGEELLTKVRHKIQSTRVRSVSFYSKSRIKTIVWYSNLAVVTLLLEYSHIHKNGGSHQNRFFFSRDVWWEAEMVCIFLAATLVLPTRPQRVNCGGDGFSIQSCAALNRITGCGVTDNEGHAATFPFLSVAATFHTHAKDAYVWFQTVNLLARSIKDVIFGNEATHVTDVLRSSQYSTARSVFGLQVWQSKYVADTWHQATKDTTRCFLLVDNGDVRHKIFLREKLRRFITLAGAPIVVFGSQSGRRKTGMLNVFRLAETGPAMTKATAQEATFFVNPANGV